MTIRQRDDGTIVFTDESGVEQLPSAEVEYSLVVEGQKPQNLQAARRIEAMKQQQRNVIANATANVQNQQKAQVANQERFAWLKKIRQDYNKLAMENAALEPMLRLPKGFDQVAKVENKNPTMRQNLSGFNLAGVMQLQRADADYGQRIFEPAQYRQEIVPGDEFGVNYLNLTTDMIEGKTQPKRVIVKNPQQAREEFLRKQSGNR